MISKFKRTKSSKLRNCDTFFSASLWVWNVKDNMSSIMATQDATTAIDSPVYRTAQDRLTHWHTHTSCHCRYLYASTCTSVRIAFQQYVDMYLPVCTTIQTRYSTLLLSISYKTLARACCIRSRGARRSTMLYVPQWDRGGGLEHRYYQEIVLLTNNAT